MRIIDIPEPVTVLLKLRLQTGQRFEETKEVAFTEWLKEVADGYRPFAKSPKNARQYDKIMSIIEAVDSEKQIQFEDADFEVLKRAAEDADWITPEVNRAYLPFYEALERAQDVPVPTEKK